MKEAVLDGIELEGIKQAFEQFHDYFCPTFGRKQWQERSADYIRALLLQSEERANAENLSEVVEASPRVLQRFLTEARWCDQLVIKRLQQFAQQRLEYPEAVFAVDGSDFPKQGKRSVGVARQYCGALGKVASCQAGVFLAYSSPRGRLLVDKRLYLPQAWTQDALRCDEAEIPKEQRKLQTKPELALSMLRQAKEWGYLRAAWVTGDDAFGACSDFRDSLNAQGWLYLLDVPGHTYVWPMNVAVETKPYSGKGRPPQPQPISAGSAGQSERSTMADRERVPGQQEPGGAGRV